MIAGFVKGIYLGGRRNLTSFGVKAEFKGQLRKLCDLHSANPLISEGSVVSPIIKLKVRISHTLGWLYGLSEVTRETPVMGLAHSRHSSKVHFLLQLHPNSSPSLLSSSRWGPCSIKHRAEKKYKRNVISLKHIYLL